MWTLLIALTALAETPAAEPLPPIESEMTQGKCERPVVKKVRNAIPGADEYYTGGFSVAADGSVTGFEKRILFANSEWRRQKESWAHGEDCVVIWAVTGRRAPVTACTGCDFAVHFEANVDYKKSTCKMRITVDGNHIRGAYDIDKKDDGTIEVFFSNSGKRFARGYWRGESFNWLTEHRCEWF